MNQPFTKHKIALGAWAWGTGIAGGDQVFGNTLSAEQLAPVFNAAVEQGLTFWDTAAVYGMGTSESLLGQFIQQHDRSKLMISTKFTPQIADEGDRDAPIQKMLDGSKTRLHTNDIDIYWIHNPADVEKWTTAIIPVLKRGEIKALGVSNHNLAEIKQASAILAKEGLHISAVQNHFSLLHRSSEDAGILRYCQENNMTFFAYMVLEQGALSGKYSSQQPFPTGSDRAQSYNRHLPKIDTLIQAIHPIAEKYHASPAQIAIAWAIGKGTLPIIGVTKVEQVHDAAKAASISLTAQEVTHLEHIAQQLDISTIRQWEKPMA